jgi:RNA polymerase sigma-70 factor (ECF subfamily)
MDRRPSIPGKEDAVEDKTIIELYFRRSERALDETVIKYGAYCRTVAQNVLTRPEDAEECVNDTWLAAWNDIPPSRPDSLRAYLGRLTRNLAITRWRAMHAKKRFDGMEALLSELEDCLPAPDSVEREVERAELSAVLRSWVDSLSAPQRQLFVRRYWYGDTASTLAKKTGISEAGMSRKLSRMRESLREHLAERGDEI